MISDYSKKGRAIEAKQLFDQMIEPAFKPSSHSYIVVITRLVKKNHDRQGMLIPF